MDQNVLKDIIENTHALINAPSCSGEAKAAAQRWLDAVGTEAERAETKKYIAELEEDIMPIDTLIGFAQSEKGTQYFGADAAANIAAHAKDRKAAGAQYCDCPACTAAAEILARKKELF